MKMWYFNPLVLPYIKNHNQISLFFESTKRKSFSSHWNILSSFRTAQQYMTHNYEALSQQLHFQWLEILGKLNWVCGLRVVIRKLVLPPLKGRVSSSSICHQQRTVVTWPFKTCSEGFSLTWQSEPWLRGKVMDCTPYQKRPRVQHTVIYKHQTSIISPVKAVKRIFTSDKPMHVPLTALGVIKLQRQEER